MRGQEHHRGLVGRVLQGAQDLLWQRDPVVPGRAAAAAADSAAAAAAPVADGMTVELMALVMSRPTAYASLAETIAALSAIPMDEATRYRSAFAVLQKTQRRTVEQITQAVDVHLSVLESEQMRFAGQSKHTEDGEIAARLQEVDALNAAAAQAERQIERLRAETDAQVGKIRDEMRIQQARAADLSRQAELKRQSILQTTRNFSSAAEAVKTALANEKAKVRQYLESTDVTNF